VALGERGFVFDGGGGVMALGRDGQRLWSIRLDAPAAGKPIVEGDSIWFLDREGRLYGRALADGSARRRLDLGIAPSGGIVGLGGRAFVPVARGSLQSLVLAPAPDPVRKP
jgi:hypothetical protein